MNPSHLPPILLLAEESYQGINGFIPNSRGSLMLDVVFLAMFVVLPVLAVSIWLVKKRGKYQLHKTLQPLVFVFSRQMKPRTPGGGESRSLYTTARFNIEA